MNAGATPRVERGRVVVGRVGQHGDPAAGVVRERPVQQRRERGEVDAVVDDESVAVRGAARTRRRGRALRRGGPSRWPSSSASGASSTVAERGVPLDLA